MSTLLSPNFFIGHIRISSIEGASCLNMGNNWPTNFESFSKTTQGFGEIAGDGNLISGARAGVTDSEILDMLNIAGNDDVPDWVKELVVEASRVALNNDQ